MFEGFLFYLTVTIYNRGSKPAVLQEIVVECPAPEEVAMIHEKYNRGWGFYIDVKCEPLRGRVL